MEEFLAYFWATVQASSSLLLLGLGLSGVIHLFLPEQVLVKHLGPGKKASIFKAALLGAPLPLCSCSVIPTAISLRKKGASVGATSSFLISTPETGVDSITLTYALMDLPMTFFRPIGALVSAIVAGHAQEFFNQKHNGPRDEGKVDHCHPETHEHSSTPHPPQSSWWAKLGEVIRYGYFDLLQDFALWMLVGFTATALMSMYIPDDFFTNIGKWQSQLLVILIAIPLYICASASTPIGAALLAKGLSPGTVLIFMLVGPATNLSSIIVLNKYLGVKGTIINLASIIVCALAMGFLVDYFYASFLPTPIFRLVTGQERETFSTLETLSSIVLLGLMVKGIYSEHIASRLKKSKGTGTDCCNDQGPTSCCH